MEDRGLGSVCLVSGQKDSRQKERRVKSTHPTQAAVMLRPSRTAHERGSTSARLSQEAPMRPNPNSSEYKVKSSHMADK